MHRATKAVPPRSPTHTLNLSAHAHTTHKTNSKQSQSLPICSTQSPSPPSNYAIYPRLPLRETNYKPLVTASAPTRPLCATMTRPQRRRWRRYHPTTRSSSRCSTPSTRRSHMTLRRYLTAAAVSQSAAMTRWAGCRQASASKAAREAISAALIATISIEAHP